MAFSIEKLSEYLSYSSLNGSMKLISDETEEIDQQLCRKDDELPWNRPTCLAVICYVIKFCSNSDDDMFGHTIKRLNYLAKEYYAYLWKWADDNTSPEAWAWEEIKQESRQEISDILVNSFMPKVQKFFKVPKVEDLVSDKLKENEVLAGFLDFLLQILNSEAGINSEEEERYAILQKDLTFLLTILGDVPFQWTELEEVKNVLIEFETLANEAGSFIYSCIFSTLPVKASRFIEGRNSLSKMVEHLNLKIRDHCIKFSEPPLCVSSRKHDAIDLIFIIDSLIEDLENLMKNQVNLIINDEMEVHIKTLFEELTVSQSLIKDIGIPQDTLVDMDELNESLVQIRDVAYEAEYLVNSYVVGNLPLWHLNLRLPAVIPQIKLIGTKLLEIKTIYDINVLKVMKDFIGQESLNVMKTSSAMVDNTVVALEDERSKTLGDLAHEGSTKFDNIVVGFEDERTKILGELIEGSKNRQIISIFGMPGLGKTTIARMLYDDPAIYGHFDKRIWCVVSQAYQKRKVLTDILMNLSSMSNILKKEDEILTVEIYQCLKKRRYLIVLDDVRSTNVWDDLGRFFPDDKNGSRIVFTSRIKGTTPTQSIFHLLPLLKEDKCWELLEKKVFLKEPCPPQLIGIGKRIAAKCNGLPIAVVVTAGILLNLKKKENEWKIVETNLDSYIFDDDTSNCMQILELSYKHLPNHLKLCFLYFGAFPEDTNISLRKLIWLWIAEGFILRDQDQKNQEQVAEEYLLDLINRSLVIIAKRSYDGGVKACIMHDLLRDMCLRKAQEENFLKSIKDRSSIYDRHHRLCVHSTRPVDQRPFGLHCRSFSGHVSQYLSSFPQMALLRVVDQLPTPRNSYELKKIYLLVLLRYMAVDRMPKPLIGNLMNLEFLCIKSSDKVYIPSAILKLVRLRHMYIKHEAAEFEKDVDSSQTNNLRSLSFVCIKNDKDEEILRCSPHLRKLKCKCTDETLFPDLRSLIALESLKMVFGKKFIGELSKINFPSTIKKLSLGGLYLPWEKISIVGRLPNLHVLKLASNAFDGEEWETSDDEFQELRFLKLESFCLKKWITYSEHFPKLESLVLGVCRNLKEIPSELGDIPTLQCIQVLSFSYEASLSALRIQEQQREYGNEELKVIITNSRW